MNVIGITWMDGHKERIRKVINYGVTDDGRLWMDVSCPKCENLNRIYVPLCNVRTYAVEDHDTCLQT